MPHKLTKLPGPLTVSKANPRYFAVKDADGNERTVYLTGSHIWNNLQDGLGVGNFIRLWRREHFKSNAGAADFHLNMSPQPWPRTGEGVAKDGKPKLDLSRFNDEYFARLRERVIAAGAAKARRIQRTQDRIAVVAAR